MVMDAWLPDIWMNKAWMVRVKLIDTETNTSENT